MPQTAKAHCNNCLRKTNHQILFENETPWSDIVEDIQLCDGSDRYLVLKCMGCEDIHFEHHHWFSGEADDQGVIITQLEHYPPTIIRQRPIWQRDFFPFNWHLKELSGLIDEIYDAHAVGAYRLAVMGIRALTERVMIDQVGDQGTFEKNIKKFCSDGFVAKIQEPLFRETLIESGHAAMHRNFSPSSETVATLLDILEGIINVIYYQPLKADKVTKSIPKRSMDDDSPL